MIGRIPFRAIYHFACAYNLPFRVRIQFAISRAHNFKMNVRIQFAVSRAHKFKMNVRARKKVSKRGFFLDIFGILYKTRQFLHKICQFFTPYFINLE